MAARRRGEDGGRAAADSGGSGAFRFTFPFTDEEFPMTTTRRRLLQAIGLGAAAAATLGAAPAIAHGRDDGDDLPAGAVFTSSNAVDGNELLVYARGRDGRLALAARAPTGGLGSGAGLGSQGAVTLSGDGRLLYVVNAGSHSVSTFGWRGDGPRLLSVVASGGVHPISVAEADGLVYVLNDGGDGNVAGFRWHEGTLRPLAGAIGRLSAAGGTAPAQVGFSDDGDALVVTEKATQRLSSWRVGHDGRLGPAVVTASPGATPFGFAFNRRNRLVVTEAVGGAAGASTVSSYRFGERDPARATVVSASVPNGQTASCWVSVTPSGRLALVANTGSSDISSYRIAGDGRLVLLQAVAASTGAGSAPADTAVSSDGRRFYVRNGRVATIGAFVIGHDGTLLPTPFATDLPATAVGLAAS